MRFVGQVEVAAFLRDHPDDTERLQAWVAEIRYCNWRDSQELLASFRDVDISRSPLIVFRFRKPPIRIETITDFRTGVLVLLAIKLPVSEYLNYGDQDEH